MKLTKEGILDKEVVVYGWIRKHRKQKKVGFIENGTWAPMAAKVMNEKLSKCKNLEIIDTTVKLLSSLDSNATKQIEELAEKLV